MKNVTYGDYKESGIYFIGKVPSHWKIKKAKHIAHFNMGQAPDSKSVNDTGDGLPFIQGNSEFGAISPTEKYYCTEPTKICSASNILVSVRAPVGALNIADKPYVIGRGLAAIHPSDLMDKSYFWFMLQSQIPQLLTKETGTTFKAVSGDDLRNLSFPLPNITEQREIAAFLEIETKRIDSLITEKQNFITLLKEKRQALISHFVTKGLDANVPMKDSGVEWIGEVPEHWELKRLKQLTSVSVGLVINPSSYFDDNGVVPMITGKNVTSKGIVIDNVDRITEQSNLLLEKTRVWKDDLVTMRVGYPGRTSLVTEEFDGINCASVIITRKSPLFLSEFICYWAKSSLCVAQVDMNQEGTGQKVVNTSAWQEFIVPYPPKKEQEIIVKHIAAETHRLDSLESEVERSVQLLKEHRTALISAAVTGKIDVRGMVDTKEGAA